VEAGSAIGLAASVTASPPSGGADLLGWSAVPLLANAAVEATPWLFLVDRTSAWLSSSVLADAQFAPAAGDYRKQWTFGDGALGGVVIDGESVARSVDDAALERVLAEARRVVGHGDVLLVCAHRFIPRRRHAWREYGRQSVGRWRRAAERLRVDARPIGFVQLDGPRVVKIVSATEAGAPRRRQLRDADRQVLRVSIPGQVAASVLSSILGDASRALGLALQIDDIAVRKIGKTAVFLSGAERDRYIMRVARSPIAFTRAVRGFEALEWHRRSSLPESARGCVPLPVARGTHRGYSYFIETCLSGRPGPLAERAKGLEGGWNLGAARYVSSLHCTTARRAYFGDGTMGRLVHEPTARLARACDSPEARHVFRHLVAVCESRLRGRTLPLVRTHGDFTESNCLFDAHGSLTGVVDWEVSVAEGFPLLDLLQLMPVAGESSTHSRWQRFDAWLDLWRKPDGVEADPVFRAYLDALDIPREAVPALILMQWVSHLAERVEARRDDERWMRLRVWQPLESLGRMLRD
jgi:hypothetical protein